MNQILDFIRLEEAIELVLLATLLAFIGGQMSRPDSETYRKARKITGAVFLLYTGLGLFTWGLTGVTDLLLIVVRAVLASAVSFGVALVTLTPTEFLVGKLKQWMPPPPKPKPHQPTPEPPIPVVVRDYAAEAKSENERMSKVSDARFVASQFYDEHVEMLKETLPQALFQTKLQTRFSDAMTPEQAWSAAEQMIAEMLPLIAKAREQTRADLEAQRLKDEQTKEEEKRRLEIDGRRNAFQKLAVWYQKEQETVKESLPEGQDRDDALRQLFDRYDQLMKETYAEMKP